MSILKSFAPVIRMGGNFGVTFFSSFTTFDFVLNVPQESVFYGAVITSCITSMLSLCYEARRFQLGRRN